jgi:biotin operon repressor
MLLAENPRSREAVLGELGIGLRTFYRELELLKRCGVKIQQKNKSYTLMATASQAEGRLPFPDPQLSFAEMQELARCPGDAGKRLSDLLASVINQPVPARKQGGSRKKKG